MTNVKELIMFKDPLTELDLYWIGYFRADGCISRGKYKNAQFTQNQSYPVEEFAKYIGKEGKVRSVSRDTNFGLCTYYSVSSARIAYLLDEFGTKTNLRKDIYESLDFWRGLLDGDGSVGKDPYGGNSPVIKWNGCEEDMQHIAYMLGKSALAHHTIWRVVVKGRQAYSLLGELYRDKYSANQVKQAKALEMINADFQ